MESLRTSSAQRAFSSSASSEATSSSRCFMREVASRASMVTSTAPGVTASPSRTGG
jgi:hypothetical protein